MDGDQKRFWFETALEGCASSCRANPASADAGVALRWNLNLSCKVDTHQSRQAEYRDSRVLAAVHHSKSVERMCFMLRRGYIRTSGFSRRGGAIGGGSGKQVAELVQRVWSKELCAPGGCKRHSRNFREKEADRTNTSRSG